jgi:hypothetical protein
MNHTDRKSFANKLDRWIAKQHNKEQAKAQNVETKP